MFSSDKPLLEKSRSVKSRHLSPVSSVEQRPSLPPSPNRHAKQKTSVKHKGSLLNGVWPSSTPNSLKSDKENPQAITLADCLGNDRKRDSVRSSFLSKQKSCSEFNRFENIPKKENSLKENHKPIFGGSMRYTGKFRFSAGRSSVSSSSSSSDGVREELAVIMPGRLSVDDNELRRKSYSRMRSDNSFSDDSECSDFGSPIITERNSPASYMAPTLSFRNSMANSPMKSTIKKAMKKANSLSLSSKWNSLAGRSESPPMTTNSTFSSSKPPTSPSKTPKRNFLYMGLDLIKSKKNGSGCLSPLGEGMGMVENVHQLRMLHGSYIRWRYVNARANVVNETLNTKSKNQSLQVWERVVKLQQSVLQKRLQLEKEKLEMKLNFIFHSQMKLLEAWRDMERRHISDVSMTKDCLEAVACRVPLIQGAKMDLQTTAIALRHAADLVSTIMTMTLSLMPTTCEIVPSFTELAKVAVEEKSLLEECFDHFRVISTLEIEEQSLRCSIIGMSSL
uniref:QWRF motif-containing protein 3-like n=1 Tax=Erigeron canadensis TaxID=72917 RepID=UPI001CB8FB79|nr:QWRF motif-containing protein 3-like [Erigeron canadensis]